MKKNEFRFLLAICIGTFIFEIANINGLGLCAFLPMSLTILFIGLKLFPKKPKIIADQE